MYKFCWRPFSKIIKSNYSNKNTINKIVKITIDKQKQQINDTIQREICSKSKYLNNIATRLIKLIT